MNPTKLLQLKQLPLMKAQDYSPKRLSFPCYVQPKLNGLNARYYNGEFISRDNKVWSSELVKPFVEELHCIFGRDVMLCGEFYKHGWSLQDVNSAIGVNRKESILETYEVEFHIFDYFYLKDPYAKYVIRVETLSDVFRGYPFKRIKFVPPLSQVNLDQVEKTYQLFIKAGYEGAVYRVGNCPYKNGRSYQLLKRKNFQDLEAFVLGVEKGLGKYLNCLGALRCITNEGKEFKVGTGFTDIERLRYLIAPEEILEKTIKVQYLNLSETGVPLNPSFLGIVEDLETTN